MGRLFGQRPRTASTSKPPRARPVEAGSGSDGSNQAALDEMKQQQAAEAGQATDQAAATPTVTITRTLKVGSSGDDVKALQRFLKIDDDGDFGGGTKEALQKWQRANKLDDDGIAGRDTRTVLGGGEVVRRDALASKHHDDAKFVPAYRATAQSESDEYRTKADPYAVGARSNPTKKQDLGGKTYGTYQFESYVYSDGKNASDKLRDGSTVMRFVNWARNPFGKELKAVVTAHGVATKEFDAKWAELTARDNKGFGKAQEDFLLVDVKEKVDAWFDAAGVDAAVRKDTELFDVVLGTINQYSSLADGMAKHIAAKQAAAGKKLSADEIGVALQDHKWGNVTSNFKSSPKAHTGIRNRVNREGELFDGYQRKPHPKK